MYPILFSDNARRDIARLRRENPKFAAKLWDLLLDIMEHPFQGLGEPEPLKGNFRGWWSRRITQEHRLVYRVQEGHLEVVRCHGHYDD